MFRRRRFSSPAGEGAKVKPGTFRGVAAARGGLNVREKENKVAIGGGGPGGGGVGFVVGVVVVVVGVVGWLVGFSCVGFVFV